MADKGAGVDDRTVAQRAPHVAFMFGGESDATGVEGGLVAAMVGTAGGGTNVAGALVAAWPDGVHWSVVAAQEAGWPRRR